MSDDTPAVDNVIWLDSRRPKPRKLDPNAGYDAVLLHRLLAHIERERRRPITR